MSITFDNVKISQGSFTLEANFTIDPGHKVALLGPSGGGKSTLLSAIAGFKSIDHGRILFGGADITEMAPAARPVALLFQDHNLFPHLTAEQNIALGIRPNLRLNAQEWETVAQAISRVGLDGLGAKTPAELSGGQQQRIALARCLLREKPLLCLDEPFAALGPALKHEMLDLVGEIVDATNASMLMVTHQPEDAIYIADQTVLVADGVAMAPMNTQNLMADPPAVLAQYLGR
ncbi:thiamine import ATP-binding protein ThiQ [Amylibacter marinus]|uniref:Thiamine import ATP-binding protein ThiQ n=1 Tax=Amylibacter marinus TaxID=1475483 RepID=A0ABQ5VVD7_9RHOB|nr:ATP-binding cassette domain-containing protein [Amylibacter marinus]GLQ35295.1 thiamine import ATP-binding protein ThiQ [Amylibacter marinus]